MSEKAYTPRPLRTAVSDHVGGGTPPRQVPSYWKGNIPWASVKDFPEQAGVITDTQEHISLAGLNASASNVIPAGTPLVCTRMAVGRAAMPSVPIAINQDVKALFLAAGVSVAYLLKLLQFVQPRAEALAVGSTVKGIRIQDYLNIDVPIAETNAQPIIAAVLDTLDTAIHETEAIIAKL
ncbi:restriction endonuclease subunit S, partial [uncultured Azohydromonas sp.]